MEGEGTNTQSPKRAASLSPEQIRSRFLVLVVRASIAWSERAKAWAMLSPDSVTEESPFSLPIEAKGQIHDKTSRRF